MGTHDGFCELPPVLANPGAFGVWRTGVMTGPMIGRKGTRLACVTRVARAVLLVQFGVGTSGFGGAAGSDSKWRGAGGVPDWQRCPGIGPVDGCRDGPAPCPALVPALALLMPLTTSLALTGTGTLALECSCMHLLLAILCLRHNCLEVRATQT
jgi:hypothetical protein